MKRVAVAVNAFILTVSIAVLHTVVFLGSAYLISPGHLLIPRPLPASVILDLLILCVLPAMFIAIAYVMAYIWLKHMRFLNSFLNIVPLILLVAMIFAIDNTFGHAVRNFSEREFFSYTTPSGTAFVFPNVSRLLLVAIFASIILAVLRREFEAYRPADSSVLSKKVVKA